MRMNHAIRMSPVLCACGLALATAGCGSASPATATSNATADGPSASASTVACANPQVSSAHAPATHLALAATDLPSGGPVLAQISDGRMNNTANTDQRGFANSSNTYRIEDDVVLDASTQTATADYPQLRDAAKTQFATVTSTSSPAGLGCQVDEFTGTTSAGYSQIGIAFQDGDVIAVVLLVNSAAPVDPTFAGAVALAQDQKIIAASS
jgi:pyruvate/2-oxoglutarate dehydrogenase complex dihydrolipoamide acyltransferase (E2) component